MRRAMSSVVGMPLLVLALLVAGCTDGDPSAEPTPSPPASSPSPSASPTPTASDPPRAETPVEFIRRFVDTQNQMLISGDTSDYLKLVTKGCDTCAGLVGRVEAVYSKGGYIDTQGWRVTKTVFVGGSGQNRVVRVWVDSAPTEYVDREGGSKKTFAGGRLLQQFELARESPGFRVRDYSEVST